MAFVGARNIRVCHRALVEANRVVMVRLFGQTLGKINSRPPNNMDKEFDQFLKEAEQIPVPRSLLPKLTEKFNTKVEFWRARGIVMIIFGTSAYCFMVAKKILAHYQDGEAPKSPQRRPSSVPRVCSSFHQLRRYSHRVPDFPSGSARSDAESRKVYTRRTIVHQIALSLESSNPRC